MSFRHLVKNVLERESEIVFNKNEMIVRLVIQSNTALNKVATRLDLIDTSGIVQSSIDEVLEVEAGKLPLEFRLPIDRSNAHHDEDIAWYRLRYSVGDVNGIVAVSQIAKQLFELRIIAASNIMAGMGYRVRVRSVKPFLDEPAAGVQVEATIELDAPEGDTQKEFKAASVTDAEGFAVLDFAIPAELELGDDGEVTVIGRQNGIVREASENLTTLGGDAARSRCEPRIIASRNGKRLEYFKI